MRCDTCQKESATVLRVVVDKNYNRSLARALFNCPACFEAKERLKRTQGKDKK
ncbi:MAG: hypothetical protein HYU33_00790 [Candidatus Omnitrophica bacterium]|nr:hypothetical protein [Candidatus Omnitrophota bacterium]MBI3009750.1 hypothetical protein [Candidatus Omnitrophota bacterium]